MKKTNYSLLTMTGIVALTLCFFPRLTLAQTNTVSSGGQSLTGAWKDDNGAIYCVRQIDHDIYWSMENLPRVRNIFVGVISGKYFAGKWIDLPGGNIVGSGALTLEVTGPDRFVKIDETSGPYGGKAWTRMSDNNSCGSKNSSGNSPSSPCGLGIKWEENEEGWAQIWTRRGESNIFDVVGTKPGHDMLKATQTIEINGNRVLVHRTWVSDGNTCEMEGTIAADGVTVTGNYRCKSGGPYSWQAIIRCNN